MTFLAINTGVLMTTNFLLFILIIIQGLKALLTPSRSKIKEEKKKAMTKSKINELKKSPSEVLISSLPHVFSLENKLPFSQNDLNALKTNPLVYHKLIGYLQEYENFLIELDTDLLDINHIDYSFKSRIVELYKTFKIVVENEQQAAFPYLIYFAKGWKKRLGMKKQSNQPNFNTKFD